MPYSVNTGTVNLLFEYDYSNKPSEFPDSLIMLSQGKTHNIRVLSYWQNISPIPNVNIKFLS